MIEGPLIETLKDFSLFWWVRFRQLTDKKKLCIINILDTDFITLTAKDSCGYTLYER